MKMEKSENLKKIFIFSAVLLMATAVFCTEMDELDVKPIKPTSKPSSFKGDPNPPRLKSIRPSIPKPAGINPQILNKGRRINQKVDEEARSSDAPVAHDAETVLHVDIPEGKVVSAARPKASDNDESKISAVQSKKLLNLRVQRDAIAEESKGNSSNLSTKQTKEKSEKIKTKTQKSEKIEVEISQQQGDDINRKDESTKGNNSSKLEPKYKLSEKKNQKQVNVENKDKKLEVDRKIPSSRKGENASIPIYPFLRIAVPDECLQDNSKKANADSELYSEVIDIRVNEKPATAKKIEDYEEKVLPDELSKAEEQEPRRGGSDKTDKENSSEAESKEFGYKPKVFKKYKNPPRKEESVYENVALR
ncbi:hypothetical protein CHUAL_003022 [Chamberlinius hualienensis]